MSSAAENPPSACPYHKPADAAPAEQVDPRNMMPKFSQDASKDQKQELSKDREVSTIPKTGEKDNWVYPSSQMFYHALKKKSKTVDEEDVDDVVRVHNWTNEESWRKVMEWEKMHEKTCPNPTLDRFVGLSEDLSTKGWLSSKFGRLGRPFDRHDWYVDRCGKRVRYVIDYYDDPKAGNVMDVTIDARPASDNLGGIWDRLRKSFTG
mmetsp:Transcript_27213/g.65531  ORF Transcript_27213/g.65531 Transcript_27213/m.65531 type:complete len:207 (+) Transcript_27213:40-660(+)